MAFQIIYKAMIDQIIADLTIGREDENLERFSNDQINEVIKKYSHLIVEAAKEYIRNAEEMDEDPSFFEDDWIREYCQITDDGIFRLDDKEFKIY